VGSRKNPIWRVVVADQRSPRDGRVIETIGRYNAQTEPSQIVIDEERLQHWLARGAQPTDTVRRLIRAVETGPTKRATETRPKKKAAPAAEAPVAVPDAGEPADGGDDPAAPDPADVETMEAVGPGDEAAGAEAAASGEAGDVPEEAAAEAPEEAAAKGAEDAAEDAAGDAAAEAPVEDAAPDGDAADEGDAAGA
jgi:small subunit ribosomal protein S16